MFRNVISVLLPVLLVVSCSQQRQDLPLANKVRIGVDVHFPPFESLDEQTGEPEGFDIDLINEICRINNWDAEFIDVPFENIISELTAGRCDIAISAITISEKRKVAVAFSDPYYLAGQSIAVVQTDSSTTDLSDLRGKRVGVMSGSTGEAMAKRVDGILVFPYERILTAFEELSAGNLDAVVNDYPMTRAYLERQGGARLVELETDVEYYGIAVRLQDEDRLAKVNRALAVLFGDGTFEKRHVKWFGYPLLGPELVD